MCLSQRNQRVFISPGLLFETFFEQFLEVKDLSWCYDQNNTAYYDLLSLSCIVYNLGVLHRG